MANPLSRSLASLFRSKADVTSLKRLAREGIRTVNVLDFSQIESVIGEAIERALREATGNGTSGPGASPHRVAMDAQFEFLRILGAEDRFGEKRDELSRESASLESNLGALRAALSQSQAALQERETARDRATMAELRAHLDSSLREAFERAGARVTAIAPEATEALAQMQEPLRAAMLGLLGAALDRRPLGSEPSAEETEAELLQRRVKKLTAQLEETQQLLERVRSEKSAEFEGIASIYKDVQGLKGTEDRIEQRRALMREIFEHNVDLRRSLADASKPADPPLS